MLCVYLGCRLSSQHRDYEGGKDEVLVRAGCEITAQDWKCTVNRIITDRSSEDTRKRTICPEGECDQTECERGEESGR